MAGKKGKDKGKRGKKKGKNSIGLPPPPSPPPPSPPPPSYANIFECTIANLETFNLGYHQLQHSRPTFVLFRPAEEKDCQPPTGKLSLEKCIRLYLIDMLKDPDSTDINFVIVDVHKDEKELMDKLRFGPEEKCSRRPESGRVLPILLRWGGDWLLEGDDPFLQGLLDFYFTLEEDRMRTKYDMSGEHCPFLPPPPPPLPDPIPPQSPRKESKKKKNSKKRKGSKKKNGPKRKKK